MSMQYKKGKLARKPRRLSDSVWVQREVSELLSGQDASGCDVHNSIGTGEGDLFDDGQSTSNDYDRGHDEDTVSGM